MAKWLSVRLRIESLRDRISLQSPKLQVSRLFPERSSLTYMTIHDKQEVMFPRVLGFTDAVEVILFLYFTFQPCNFTIIYSEVKKRIPFKWMIKKISCWIYHRKMLIPGTCLKKQGKNLEKCVREILFRPLSLQYLVALQECYLGHK